MSRKRIIALLVSVLYIIFASGIQAFSDEPEKNDEGFYADEVKFLTSIGIFKEDFEPYFEVTRAEFTEMIARVMYNGVDFSSAGEYNGKIFNDVSYDNEFYPYIKACKDLDIVKGDNNNYFHPDDEITINAAVVMAINALGYTLYAKAAGGYPSGYLAVAKNTGIMKDISSSYRVNGYVAAKIIYNSLFADLITIDSVTNGEIAISKDSAKNILSERLGISEYDARVFDNGYIALDGNSISDGERVVLKTIESDASITAFKGNTDIDSHLGGRVKAYVKLNEESGKNEVIYYNIHRKSSESIYPAHKITELDSSSMKYEEADSSVIKTISFARGGPIVLFNGTKISGNISSYLPQDGILRAIDYDGDNKVDFLDILSFNVRASENDLKMNETAWNIAVGRVDEEEKYIGCKFNPSVSLNAKKENSEYIFVLNDKVKSFGDLKENNIVSVAQSPSRINGKYIYQLAVSSQTLTGGITSSDKENHELSVGDERVKVSSSVYAVKTGFFSSLDYGYTYNFSLDITGKIAYSKSMSVTVKNYAYLLGTWYKSGAEELYAKVFTKEGKMEEYTFASKVVVDGKQKSNAYDIAAALKKREEGSNPAALGAPADIYELNYSRPVIIELNGEGKIKSVDTDNRNYDEDSGANYYSSENIIRYSKTEAEDYSALKAGFRNPRVEELTRYTSSVSGRYYVTADTLVIQVPDIDIWGLDCYAYKLASNKNDAGFNQSFSYDIIKLYELDKSDDNYHITNGGTLNYTKAYDIQGYDIDEDTGVASLVVLRGSVQPYIYGRVPYDLATYPLAVFLKKTEVYDSANKKNITKLYYTLDGEHELSANVDVDETLYAYKNLINGISADQPPYYKEVTPLKKGDIIRVIKNGSDLAHIERVVHTDNVKNSLSSLLFPSFPRVMYSESLNGILTMPCDERNYYAGYQSGYYVAGVYPKEIRGSIISSYMGKRNVSDVDLNDPLSYIMQLSNIEGVSFVKVTYKDGDTKVEKGNLSDIKTADEYGIDNASILVYHDYYHQVNKMIIVNFE